MTNTKQTPKSCSCGSCARGKHTDGGRFMRRADERSYRHAANMEVRMKGEEAILSSGPIGNYYD